MVDAPKQKRASLPGLFSTLPNSSTMISEQAIYIKVPPATLNISEPTISGAFSKPKPTATPVDSVKAKPNYTNKEVLRGVLFFLREEPKEIAMTN